MYICTHTHTHHLDVYTRICTYTHTSPGVEGVTASKALI